jgi:hypothetical protein
MENEDLIVTGGYGEARQGGARLLLRCVPGLLADSQILSA